MPMLSLLGANHRLPLFYIAKPFIWINEAIGYMINLGLNVRKTFREQVEKCMFNTFGAITQHFIKSKMLKDKTRVLALILFYDTI